MALDTIGSIATFINESFTDISTGVSGNMVEIVDMNRQHVANFVGQNIGSNSIDAQFQPPIVNFSKADTMDFINADGGNLKIAELSLGDHNEGMSATAWRQLAESQLNSLGRKVEFRRSLS